jgi:hypothetical protein
MGRFPESIGGPRSAPGVGCEADNALVVVDVCVGSSAAIGPRSEGPVSTMAVLRCRSVTQRRDGARFDKWWRDKCVREHQQF